ncbi:zf-CCHC domain-containing protein/UBN2 domain-containing protein [Cephalotus follicularis]|uniref:Zf-CCHC domain-containing protein/UBN2 domain-containing protein n=1 Tax=Cephalotus follicularis TaxID=3775 RepID=A0A1Q3ALN1_CEPFO|nr:zf-CCHC domain-containing protein/UBN2 domain-containing protein [Cephalotus follicularis]
MVRKILRCLPRIWMSKVTAIEEAKDLRTLPLEDLLSSLMTHEFDQEMALIMRRFKKFLASKKKFGGKVFKKNNTKKGEPSKIEEIICYECNKPGHYKSDSPRLKKKEQVKKKKAMIATWENSDDSSSDEEANEEVAQLALMAIEEEEDCDEVTYDELVLLVEKYTCIISELKKKIKCLNTKNKELKSTSILLLDKEDKNKIEFLEEENKNLKIEIDALKKTFSKFSNSSEKLEKLLGIQRCVFDKAGLGYDEMNNVKHYQNFFDRKNKIEKEKIEKDFIKKKNSFVSCNYCGKNGHVSTSCFYKNHFMSKSKIRFKKVWVSKGTIITNHPGPKVTWGPKSLT